MTAALVVLLGVFSAALLGFFAWLSKAVMDIRERTVKIEMSVASLLETRTAQKVETDAATARRLDGLERARQ